MPLTHGKFLTAWWHVEKNIAIENLYGSLSDLFDREHCEAIRNSLEAVNQTKIEIERQELIAADLIHQQSSLDLKVHQCVEVM